MDVVVELRATNQNLHLTRKAADEIERLRVTVEAQAGTLAMLRANLLDEARFVEEEMGDRGRIAARLREMASLGDEVDSG